MSYPLGPSIKAEPSEPIKCFGHWVPLYASEVPCWNKDARTLAKAVQHEAKQLAKCELTFTDPAKLKKAAYIYCASLRCLQANVLEANKRRPYRHRLSLHQIIQASKDIKILGDLNEAVEVYAFPKLSGVGFRTICNFGPVARGAHRMVLNLLRGIHAPASFQFTSLGADKAISEALKLIAEKEFNHVAELDIVSHYPSFEEEKLIKALPLPKAVVVQIVVAASANWAVQKVPPHLNHVFDQVSSGIPQGSAASSAVAEWSVSKLKLEVPNVDLINYADNFFLLSKTKEALDVALEALGSAVAGLPGGTFKCKTRSISTLDAGVPILGCWMFRHNGEVQVNISETALQTLSGRFELEMQTIEAILTTAKKDADPKWRTEGVETYLRLETYVKSWAAAYEVCADTPMILEDLKSQLDHIRYLYEISPAEVKAASALYVSAKFQGYPYDLS